MNARALLTVGSLAFVLPVASSTLGPCAANAHAEGLNRAGLVVQLASGGVQEFCVAFPEPAISGVELLERSGLPLRVQDHGAGNVTVCSIAGEGCDYPDQPCFCRCSGGGLCEFWGYYRAREGRWVFSQQGAGITEVRDGDVEGWRFGAHGLDGTQAPAVADPAGSCARGKQVSLERVAARAESPSPGTAGVLASILLILTFLTFKLRRARRGEERS